MESDIAHAGNRIYESNQAACATIAENAKYYSHEYEKAKERFREFTQVLLDQYIGLNSDLREHLKRNDLGNIYSVDEWEEMLYRAKYKFEKETIVILHVDDELDQLVEVEKMLDSLCQRHSIQNCLISANNGEEGVKKFTEHRPDIVISDIEMGGDEKDGTAFVKNILSLDPNIAIVVRSSHKIDYQEKLFVGIGSANIDHIGKVVPPENFDNALLSVLKRIDRENVKKQIELIRAKETTPGK